MYCHDLCNHLLTWCFMPDLVRTLLAKRVSLIRRVIDKVREDTVFKKPDCYLQYIEAIRCTVAILIDSSHGTLNNYVTNSTFLPDNEIPYYFKECIKHQLGNMLNIGFTCSDTSKLSPLLINDCSKEDIDVLIHHSTLEYLQDWIELCTGDVRKFVNTLDDSACFYESLRKHTYFMKYLDPLSELNQVSLLKIKIYVTNIFKSIIQMDTSIKNTIQEIDQFIIAHTYCDALSTRKYVKLCSVDEFYRLYTKNYQNKIQSFQKAIMSAEF